MAFNIILYKFNKKVNSTKVPDNSTPSISLTCNIKTSSSIINPRVELKEEPVDYNYCYIQKFNRYYFINNISYNIGLWVLDLKVDVLASFKTNILASSQYVLRSASQFNTNITDNLYTTKASGSNNFFKSIMGQVYALDISPLPEPVTFFDKNYTQGIFVVGVVSPNNSGVSYYSLSYNNFTSFLNDLMDFTPSDMSDVSGGIAKSIFDPIQFITMCKWYPIGPVPTTPSSSIKLGSYNINLTNQVGYFNNARTTKLYGDITIPKHPQISGHGDYIQLQPYSRYSLLFEPFGDITLDNTLIYGASTLRCEWTLDYCTGTTALIITNLDTGAIVGTASANMGVDIPIAQLTVDYLGGASSIASGIGGFVSSLLSLDVGGAINSVVSGIGNTAQSTAPKVSSVGSQGSFIPYNYGKPFIYLNTIEQVDIDVIRYGRPLCEIKVLNTLSGYSLCSNASIELNTATGLEKEEAETYLNGGFYIE